MQRPIPTPPQHRSIRGRIAYTSDAAADAGRVRGMESFSVTIHGDGTRIQRATSIIDDPPHVVRDVVERVDAALRPIECFVGLRVGGAAAGSGWFRWADGTASCEAETAAEGRVSQQMRYVDGPRAFCNHAIVGDAWMAANYPLAQGPGLFFVEQMFTPSLNKQGATGPRLAVLPVGLEYLGRQTVSVAAGTFETHAFRLNSIAGPEQLRREHLHYEIWTTTDGSYIAVQSMYRGQRRYELVEYSQD